MLKVVIGKVRSVLLICKAGFVDFTFCHNFLLAKSKEDILLEYITVICTIAQCFFPSGSY